MPFLRSSEPRGSHLDAIWTTAHHAPYNASPFFDFRRQVYPSPSCRFGNGTQSRYFSSRERLFSNREFQFLIRYSGVVIYLGPESNALPL